MSRRFDIESIRADFPILSREVYGTPLIYLDSGATAQKPQRVIDKVNSLHSEHNANIHRGVHYLSSMMTEQYEGAREEIRRFIGAKESAEVIFTAGATASINCVASSYAEKFIVAGDNVVVSQMEHHSNIVPWQIACERKGAEIRVLEFDDDGRLEVERLAEMIDSRTKMVAVTQASNVLGSRPDLSEVIRVSHSAGVPVLVDGCQGVVHGGVNVAEMDCDFYAFSGHKLYGPTGIGVLYGKREWLEKLPPYMGGGDMVDRVSFEGTTYAELPFKFEAGTANYIGAIGLAEAIRYIEEFKSSEIDKHENALLDHATRGLQRIEGMKIYGTQENKCSIVSFNVKGIHPTDIGMILDKLGLAIRTGTHCAQPLMDRYGVTGMCRASFGIYNTVEEVEALVRGVERAVSVIG